MRMARFCPMGYISGFRFNCCASLLDFPFLIKQKQHPSNDAHDPSEACGFVVAELYFNYKHVQPFELQWLTPTPHPHTPAPSPSPIPRSHSTAPRGPPHRRVRSPRHPPPPDPPLPRHGDDPSLGRGTAPHTAVATLQTTRIIHSSSKCSYSSG